ncbi:hypothetical protein [Paracoccus benzoatiresistens]|uniref:Peptidase C39 domain-containing protein n=1 Tax=Paracoccus benzoatiresistens TaxID=2997341 RepID=A0ABT4JA83_9RHOB|nr:hypothetical protein [Paracoccus sp. EF6]MCZ0963507.1 hypothetical protein [Paracoccus sp. EF6]
MKSVIHPGAALVTPYMQGRLDALCGLYALINAIRVVHAVDEPLSGQACRSLFKAGLKALIADKRTRAVLYDGMTAGSQRRLLRTLTSYPILQTRRPLRLLVQRPKLSTAGDLDLLVRGALKRGAVLLVCLEGRMAHHTVITGMSNHRVMLCDSSGMQFIYANSVLRSSAQPASLRIRNLAFFSC